MIKYRFFIVCILWCSIANTLRSSEKLPLDVVRLSNRLLIIQTKTKNSTVAILATQKGLVMIDTGFSPRYTKEVQAVAEDAFNRDDWYGLIQTNSGLLNAGGNRIFSGLPIISHHATHQLLESQSQRLNDILETRTRAFRDRVTRSQNQLADLEPNSERAVGLQKWIQLCRQVEKDFDAGFDIVLPTITFQQQVVLHLGDIDAHLFYFGRTPEDGEILVWVPEEGFLWLADLFVAWHILPFGSNYGPEGADVKSWINVLDMILSEGNEVKHIYRTNGAPYSHRTLVNRRDFLHDLLTEVNAADQKGLSLQETMDQLTRYEEAFPDMQSWKIELHPGITRGDIRNVIQGLWKVNHKSAAEDLSAQLDSHGIDAFSVRFQEIKNQSDYYFLENEFNGLGYRLLYEERNNEALEVFKGTVALWPESSNAYDSLGEAYLAIGDKENGMINYKKSLDLNPDNENAKRVLKEIQTKE